MLVVALVTLDMPDIAPAHKQNAQVTESLGRFPGMSGRGKRIRTSGPCVPNAVLYQAELFPDVVLQSTCSAAKPTNISVFSRNCKV